MNADLERRKKWGTKKWFISSLNVGVSHFIKTYSFENTWQVLLLNAQMTIYEKKHKNLRINFDPCCYAKIWKKNPNEGQQYEH